MWCKGILFDKAYQWIKCFCFHLKWNNSVEGILFWNSRKICSVKDLSLIKNRIISHDEWFALLFRYQTDVVVILRLNGSWRNELLNKFVWLIDRWSQPGPGISRDQSTWYHHNHLHFTNPWGHDSHYHHR